MEGCPAGFFSIFIAEDFSPEMSLQWGRPFSGKELSEGSPFGREELSEGSPFGREESSVGKNPPIDLKIAHSLGQRFAAAVIRQRTGALSSVAQVHSHQNLFILGQTQT